MKSYILFTLQILLTILIVFSHDRVRKKLFVQDPIEYSRDPVAHLREIVRNRDSEALLLHVDPEIHCFDYIRSKSDLDSVWLISRLQEYSEIWDYLQTSLDASGCRAPNYDSASIIIPHSDEFFLEEDAVIVRNCKLYEDVGRSICIGEIPACEPIIYNWKNISEESYALFDDFGVIPIKLKNKSTIHGWVEEKDHFDFANGPFIQLSFIGDNWYIVGIFGFD
jgi:hypothetical protein